ncbi:unnamed protein product, partial [Symbiodinium microadriaticum]
MGNKSANDSDAWNETEVPINISVVTEAINVSEDLLDDDNESTELDGNLSDATEENVSAVPNNSHDRWILPEDVPMVGNESANESDAWNQTEPYNGEAGNASDALEDDNESVALDGNLSDGSAENLADVSNSSRLNAVLLEGVPIMGNKSANDSDAWNETEFPINISVVAEAINASEDLLEDDNESTELDGNLHGGGPAGKPGCDVQLVVKGWFRKIEHNLHGESGSRDPILKRSAFIRSDCCSFKDTDEDVPSFENESANHSDASDAPCLLWAMRSA